jgi:aspartate dehydrogenase
MRKLGIIGCGSIGNEIAKAVDKGDINVKLTACCDRERARFDSLAANLKNVKPAYMKAEDVIKKCDLVVECAHKTAVTDIFKLAIKHKRDMMFLSVGGVLDNTDLLEEARKKGINVYIPSGAVVGIDGLNAAKYGGLKKVSLTTRKPPRAFRGVKSLLEKGIDVDKVTVETVVYDGPAIGAVRDFPQNINVAATLSLAGMGPEKTTVRIIMDPAVSNNSHELSVEGEFGKFRAVTENFPSPNNPKTSYITSLSAIMLIKKIVEPIHFGS